MNEKAGERLCIPVTLCSFVDAAVTALVGEPAGGKSAQYALIFINCRQN